MILTICREELLYITKKCNKCFLIKPMDQFKGKKGYINRCIKCRNKDLCIHDKVRATCRKCGGKSICIHDKYKSGCRKCGGSQICIHDKYKSTCRECGGKSICIHDKVRATCRKCGGSIFCVHDKRKSQCKECRGSQICLHEKRKNNCKDCNPVGHIKEIIKNRIRHENIKIKTKDLEKWIGCSFQKYIYHITSQLKDGMNWENYGQWEIDHIIPINYNNPTEEEKNQRFHYTNCQPLWKRDNISKSNRLIK